MNETHDQKVHGLCVCTYIADWGLVCVFVNAYILYIFHLVLLLRGGGGKRGEKGRGDFLGPSCIAAVGVYICRLISMCFFRASSVPTPIVLVLFCHPPFHFSAFP